MGEVEDALEHGQEAADEQHPAQHHRDGDEGGPAGDLAIDGPGDEADEEDLEAAKGTQAWILW